MYAQIRKYHSIRGGGTAEQVCQDIARNGVVRFTQIPGFVDYFALELDDGGLLTISLYENKAGVEAGKKVSADWNRTAAGGALPEYPDEAFEGEVRVHYLEKKKEAAA